jgi:hypothetical protein
MKQLHSECAPKTQRHSRSKERRGAVMRYLRELGIPEGGLRRMVKQRGAVTQIWRSLQERLPDPREDFDSFDSDEEERPLAA